MTVERSVYVYRLKVTFPPGSSEPGWEPDSWPAWCEEHGWEDFDSATGARDFPTFSWARFLHRKNFLSASSAERRAKMLRTFGALVEVERSYPVAWEDARLATYRKVWEGVLHDMLEVLRERGVVDDSFVIEVPGGRQTCR